DRDPQRLKHARRRVDGMTLRTRHATSHEIRKLPGRRDRRLLPRFHDLVSHAPTEAFLAILPEDVRELLLRCAADEGAPRFAARRIDPHIERPVGVKAEAARWIAHLIGR